MIYTVTFNPSLDYIVSVDQFQIGETNRTASEQILPGGKGINVSTVLWNLGVNSSALGFTAGFTGAEIEKRCREIGFSCDFISINQGDSRINIKLKTSLETEINGQGPVIDKASLDILYQKLSNLTKEDTLVLAGSIPKSLSDTIYQDILSVTAANGVTSIVDAAGDLLMNTLPFRPFLIKPNHKELGELFHASLETRDSVIPYALELQKLGARNVLVSLGKEGAALLTENGEIYSISAPAGTLINSVGSGDSMVAGFLAGWQERKDYLHALKMAVASGSASAFSQTFASREAILALYNTI